MGHYEHANDPNKQGGRGDVIPPFTYPGFDPFPGAGDPNQVGLPQRMREGPTAVAKALERYLAGLGLKLERAPVGDR